MLDYRNVINEGIQVTKNFCAGASCSNKRVRGLQFCQECLDKRNIISFKRAQGNSSYIYFVKLGDCVKIGVTNSIKSRLSSLQTSSPEKLELLISTEGREREEKFVHGLFKKQHVRGEWFKLDEEVQNYIECLKQGLGVYKTCEIAFK